MKVYSKGRNIYIILLIGMCLVSFYLGFFMYKYQNPKEIKNIPINDSVTINVSPFVPQSFIVKNSYVGRVEAINQVKVIPLVSGYIEKISVKEGSFVEKDNLLINIKPDEFKAKMLSADATVLQAKSNLSQ